MAALRLTIDGREVSVEPGTTVLEAARELGIRIPTLCHVEGLEPASVEDELARHARGQRSGTRHPGDRCATSSWTSGTV